MSQAASRFATHGAAVSGTLVAGLMLGAGVSAPTVGLLRSAVGLGPIFRFAALAALGMALLATALIRSVRTTSPT